MKIADFCKTAAGGTPLKSNKSFYENGDIPWLLSGEVGKKNIVETKNFITQAGLDGSSAKVFPVNTVLIAMYGATAGEVGILRCEAATNQAVCGIYPNNKVLPEYLYYFFLDHKEQLVAQAVGNAQPNISQQKIKNTEINLPPIPEQKRLVAILDEVFADIEQARAKTEQNLKNARELFESYLQQVFSQRGEGWEVKPLESFSNIVNGYAFKSGDFSTESAAKSIKITNVGVYEFVEDDTNYLPDSFLKEFDSYRAYEGDVVIALTRTIISTGLKVAVVPHSYNGALINQRVAAIQVDEKIMPKAALHAYLSSNMAVSYVKKNVSELLQPNLSIKDLRAFPVPVPPQNELEVFSVQIQSIRSQVEQLVSIYSSKLQALDELKQSILQKAFSGELTKNTSSEVAYD